MYVHTYLILPKTTIEIADAKPCAALIRKMIGNSQQTFDAWFLGKPSTKYCRQLPVIPVAKPHRFHLYWIESSRKCSLVSSSQLGSSVVKEGSGFGRVEKKEWNQKTSRGIKLSVYYKQGVTLLTSPSWTNRPRVSPKVGGGAY